MHSSLMFVLIFHSHYDLIILVIHVLQYNVDCNFDLVIPPIVMAPKHIPAQVSNHRPTILWAAGDGTSAAFIVV